MNPPEVCNPADGDKPPTAPLPDFAYNQPPFMSRLTHAEELKLRAQLADAQRRERAWEELAHFWHGRAVELTHK